MTIDEAIKHCEDNAEMYDDRRFHVDDRPDEVKELDYALGEAWEKAGIQREEIDIFNPQRAADENRQLAEWLTELKELREEKEIALSVRGGTKAKYNYTDEQVTAYWQGVEDCAKGTIDKRQKCELDILRGINGTAVAINDYRVTSGKIYGMLVTEGHFKLNCSDVIHAICQEHEALKR